jgi:hypothetical protein
MQGYFSMSNRVNISFTVYGYLKFLTILEAVDGDLPVPKELKGDVRGLLQLFRALPIMAEGAN